MTTQDQFGVTAILAACAYYLLTWRLFAKIGKLGTVVALYDPPRQLSPAMLRYVWKERLDDRTFWAGVLSLVAKGLATLHCTSGEVLIRATAAANRIDLLPKEEGVLLKELVGGHMRKEASISMLDFKTVMAVRDMAKSLRQEAIGHWFIENHRVVVGGIALSAVGLCFAASPHNKGEWGALLLALAVMAPGAFYLFFICVRVWDVLRAAMQKFDWAVLRREAMLFAMVLPCVAAIILGGVTIAGTFGWQVLATTLFLALLNAFAMEWLKLPTREGKQVLTEIAGFRLFLESVERLPMQRSDEPTDHAGLYERYLPYAVALEVEQAWGDRLVALTSTQHENAGIKGAEAFYLGMWNGKPLEIIYKPEAPRGRGF